MSTEADREQDAFVVRSVRCRAGQVDPDRQDSPACPGGLAPLDGTLLGVGERCLDLAQQGRLPDAADPVEHDHVVARRLQVLDVEARGGDVPQVLLDGGGDKVPLGLAVVNASSLPTGSLQLNSARRSAM
ncbi:hypothetical protein [Streptomyces sp. GC420]|uniref:hypothetical protein n=1 Tax=Streptomyces sp. GC420 TaxID=2697568 RepID=UPI0014151012|nr:hypothetical protein [Streptomyces sp. GC420]NBM14232.1 hypothetical protein [Streptomyces sp. GC420]